MKMHNAFRSRVTTVHLPGNSSPIAFYSLLIIAEPENMLDQGSRLRLWTQNRHFASLQLEWLAVHRSFQRRGVGTVVMGRVLDCFIETVRMTGIAALTCVAINDDTSRFYRKLGFQPYGPAGPMPHMLLPAQSALELVSSD